MTKKKFFLIGILCGLSSNLSCFLKKEAYAAESLVLHETALDEGKGIVVGTMLHSKAWLSLETQVLKRFDCVLGERGAFLRASADFPLLLWTEQRAIHQGSFSLSASTSFFRMQKFALVVEAKSSVNVQTSLPNTTFAMEGEFFLAPTYLAETWSIAPLFSLKLSGATWVKHHPLVKKAFESRDPQDGPSGDGPKDGWIWQRKLRVPFGVTAGTSLTDAVSLYGAMGLIWTYSSLDVGMFDAMMLGQWPFFAEMGVGFKL